MQLTARASRHTGAARRGRGAALASLAAASLILSACSISDSDGSAGSEPAASASTSSEGLTAGPDPASFPQVFTPKRDGSLADIEAVATQVATLDSPVALTGRAGTRDLYIVERAGRVMTLARTSDGAVAGDPEVVLDITAQTTTDSNRGLVGIAFSPDGSKLFISHTNAKGDSRVARYEMDGRRADPSTRMEILRIEQPYDDHNVGAIHFGGDGMLWVSTGDGGSLDDPDQRAQDPSDPRGKILRIDPNELSEPSIYARGLRNPFRFSFDRETGDLWLGDVGQESTEEINFLPAGTPAGTNFGWSGYEGTTLRFPERADPNSVPPIFEMAHAQGWCAAIGGVVYRGTSIPELEGVYVFGDVCQSNVHVLRLVDGAVTDERALDVEVEGMVSIDQDLDGTVWLLSLEGGVFRLDPAGPSD